MAGKSPGNVVVSEGACESRHLSERTGKKNNYLIEGQYHGEANTPVPWRKTLTLALLQETALE